MLYLSGIIIRFLSEANTEWSETRKVTGSDGKEHDEFEKLTGHEEYFQIQYYLLGGKNSKLFFCCCCYKVWFKKYILIL